MTELNGSSSETRKVSVAAVVAAHQVAIRRGGGEPGFQGAAHLGGHEDLDRAAPALCRQFGGGGADGRDVVAPCRWRSGTRGCRIGFVANRDSARLRKAISGANKTDLIDADMLANCVHVLGVMGAPAVSFGQIGLRRALRRATAPPPRPPLRVPAVGVGRLGVPRCVAGLRRPSCRPAGAAPVGPSGAAVAGPCRLDRRHRGCSQPRQASRASRRADPHRGPGLDSVLGGPSRCRRLGLGGRRAARRHRRRRLGHRSLLRACRGAVAGLLARRLVVLDPRDRADLRRVDQGVAGFGSPSPLRQIRGRVRGLEPVELGVGPIGVAFSADNQTRARRATPGLLPGGQHRPAPRPRPGCVLPQADGQPEPQPHQGQLRGGPQTRLPAWAVLQTGQPYQLNKLRDLDGEKIDQPSATAIAATLAVPDDVPRRARAHTQRGRLSQ